MFRNQSVDVHKFAMVPRADIPRSTFVRQHTHKTTFDAGYLIPVFVDEVLPGDTFNLQMTAFARLATPLFPLMDNMVMDSFFFFVPNRLTWYHWKQFMGEQANPADSISYLIPQIVSPAGGYVEGSVFDYMGLQTVGQVGGGNTISHSALPLRAYNLIWNVWFRDENLQNSASDQSQTDGPDGYGNYPLQRRGKRHDYFTGCLPWPQKGGVAVSLPLGTKAPIKGLGMAGSNTNIPGPFYDSEGATIAAGTWGQTATTGSQWFFVDAVQSSGTMGAGGHQPNIYADLTAATAATINQLRLAFQTQKLLERDARGGTRYTEIVRSHFGVISPDARLQRPEYLGGGSCPIAVNPIAQTSGTGASGTTTPVGTLSAMGTALHQGSGFTASFTEHGHVVGLVAVRADLTYQQGMRKMWSRLTRYDFYFPAFAMLGEQAVLNQEIYQDGSANDSLVFGYQERWAEYRYLPSVISGYFKSTNATPIDGWHLAQKFTSLPTLNSTFIADTPPVSRIVAVGAAANGQQFLFDSFFNIKTARPMPLYSVPGLIDHF